jgi:hypothetical protein
MLKKIIIKNSLIASMVLTGSLMASTHSTDTDANKGGGTFSKSN